MVATAIYSVTVVLWKETAFPLCSAMEKLWKMNVVSWMSSLIVVIRLPVSCVSSMAISCHVPCIIIIIKRGLYCWKPTRKCVLARSLWWKEFVAQNYIKLEQTTEVFRLLWHESDAMSSDPEESVTSLSGSPPLTTHSHSASVDKSKDASSSLSSSAVPSSAASVTSAGPVQSPPPTTSRLIWSDWFVFCDCGGLLAMSRCKVCLQCFDTVGWEEEEHLACKNWLMRCCCGYRSGSRCRLFAYGPADATAIPKPHYRLPHLNPDWFFFLSGTGWHR